MIGPNGEGKPGEECEIHGDREKPGLKVVQLDVANQ